MERVRTTEAGRHVGEEVLLRGWLHQFRQLGKVNFLIVRDGWGTFQALVDDPATLADLQGAAAAPLFPGTIAMLDVLGRHDDLLLGVATGKSRRGLDRVLDLHDLRGRFVTTQVADDHPSKPHPAMVLAALDAVGCRPGDAVMIGDTAFDMDMARAAGVATIAVSWGYHPVDRLEAAAPDVMVHDMAALAETVAETLGL